MERPIIDLSKYRFGCCHEALDDAKSCMKLAGTKMHLIAHTIPFFMECVQ